jgi:hypothetical protein
MLFAGVGSNQDGVLVLGATNVPWELDPAMRYFAETAFTVSSVVDETKLCSPLWWPIASRLSYLILLCIDQFISVLSFCVDPHSTAIIAGVVSKSVFTFPSPMRRRGNACSVSISATLPTSSPSKTGSVFHRSAMGAREVT